MTAPHIVDPAGLLGEALAEASPDLMRNLLQTVINALLSADADAVVGAEWGQRSPDRTAQRNGYRHRDLDTRVGTIDVAIPKLRTGTYFPEWLLERRKRAESALITVVADCYLAGVSTRRMDKLVKQLGINSLSKSQVSRMAADLDEQVEAFRHRPLDEAGPFTFVAADALTMKVREGGRVINAVVLIATGVNGDGHREVLGMRVATAETGAAWNEFFADLVARGLAGVRLVTSDAHAGLVEGPVAEGLDLLVQVGGHPGHLRLRQAVDAQLLDELVHPAGAHPGQITVRHHRDQRRLGPLAPLEQPLGEVRPGAQLGDRDVDRADPGVQVAVPVAVALRGPVRAALAPLGTDHRVGVGGQQRVDHRLQQVAHEVRGGFRQGLAKQAGRVDNVRCGHRDAPFESAVKGSLEDHAVAAPRLLRRGRQPRYTIIGDSTTL
uniref:Mutator family transposase n=1 Tax=Microbacterium sp. MA1 TaxID=614068 RepID=C3UMY5_9MICO|nr:truncated transposase [Microbacterium sp. MA1]